MCFWAEPQRQGRGMRFQNERKLYSSITGITSAQGIALRALIRLPVVGAMDVPATTCCFKLRTSSSRINAHATGVRRRSSRRLPDRADSGIVDLPTSVALGAGAKARQRTATCAAAHINTITRSRRHRSRTSELCRSLLCTRGSGDDYWAANTHACCESSVRSTVATVVSEDAHWALRLS